MADDGCTQEPSEDVDTLYLLDRENRRIRIVSDGSRWNTHVLDAETGNEIHGVMNVKFDLDASRDYFAIAQLEVITEMDVTVDAEVRSFRLNRVTGNYDRQPKGPTS